MKAIRWFLILILIGLSSSAAMADGIDPALGVRGGGDQTLWPGTVTFTINSDSASCDTTCDFTTPAFFIDEGTITAFDITFDTPQGVFSVEEGSAFGNVETVIPGIEAIISGGTIFPASFCIECSPEGNQIVGNFVLDMNGVTLGSNGQTLVTVSSVVSEPGTLILMLSGLGFLGLYRLRRKQLQANLA